MNQPQVMYLATVFILAVVSLALSAELLFKLYDRAVGNEKAVMLVKLGIAMWLILALSLAIWLITMTWEIWESRGRGRLYWVVAVTAGGGGRELRAPGGSEAKHEIAHSI